MKQFTREHQAVAQFKHGFELFKSNYNEFNSIELTRSLDYLESTISSFILTELHIRQGERCEVLSIFPQLQKHSITLGKRFNKKGITLLEAAIKNLDDYRKEDSFNEIVNKGVGNLLEEFKIGINEILVYQEIKPSDAAEINNELSSLVKKMSGAKTTDIALELASSKLKDLRNIRLEKGRGAEKNIAIWKLIALAAMLCIAAYIVLKCYYSRWGCSKREKNLFEIVLAIAFILFGACE